MKKLPYILLLLALLPLMAMECEEPEVIEPPLELPPITQQGANTFGCLINGDVFNVTRNRNGPTFTALYQAIDFLFIRAIEDSNNARGLFAFGLRNNEANFEGNTFSLSDTAQTRFIFELPGCVIENHPDPSQIIDGQVTINRFDFAKPFVAGQFWFIAVTPECDTLRVTDGRFDVKLL